jgi:dolichol-phosphate mannosyltransferase
MNKESSLIARRQIDFHAVRNVLVLPCYNELDSLALLIPRILENLSKSDLVIICDDSPREINQQIMNVCFSIQEKFPAALGFSTASSKMGRGAAVRRGMQIAVDSCPNFRYLLECDADQSHQLADILEMIYTDEESDLFVGSRFLPRSKIEGWPILRVVFSRTLNWLLPRIFNLDITDLTNGLRRYSHRAVRAILSKPVFTSSFIHLSEQAIVIMKEGYVIRELPTTFVNRKLGSSSVGVNELLNSFIGLLVLIREYKLRRK